MSSSAIASLPKERFVFIDALRGVAALGVLYHHMLHNSVMEVTLRRIMPHWTTIISGWGAYGVQIFFVLSGFVITHSLRNNRMDRRSILHFILRRQLRLDPPYWGALAFVLSVQAVRLRFPTLVTPPLPGVGTVALNLAYLQNISHATEVVGVAWTLCIEIQFYLFFILILAGAAACSKNDKHRAATALVFISGCASLAAIFFGDFSVWFVQYWYHFAAGALCCWSLHDRVDRRWFPTFVAVFLVGIVWEGTHQGVTGRGSGTPQLATGLLTTLLIFGVGRAGCLTTLWRNGIIQYFGRISYSLYLVHVTVAVTVLQLGYKLTGENQKMALVWFVLSGVVSIAAAHLLFIVVERPSMRLASTIRRRMQRLPMPDPTPLAD